MGSVGEVGVVVGGTQRVVFVGGVSGGGRVVRVALVVALVVVVLRVTPEVDDSDPSPVPSSPPSSVLQSVLGFSTTSAAKQDSSNLPVT